MARRRGQAGKPSQVASEAKPIKVREGQRVPVLLSGGNPRIAKADGDAPVQAYIAAMPGWKRDIGRRLDALIVRSVPNVRKAVKWNSPFYGIEGQGWFLNFHCFTKYVKVAFFRGTSLRPLPPGESTHEEVRYFDIHEDDRLDEELVASWIRQASNKYFVAVIQGNFRVLRTTAGTRRVRTGPGAVLHACFESQRSGHWATV